MSTMNRLIHQIGIERVLHVNYLSGETALFCVSLSWKNGIRPPILSPDHDSIGWLKKTEGALLPQTVLFSYAHSSLSKNSRVGRWRYNFSDRIDGVVVPITALSKVIIHVQWIIALVHFFFLKKLYWYIHFHSHAILLRFYRVFSIIGHGHHESPLLLLVIHKRNNITGRYRWNQRYLIDIVGTINVTMNIFI